MLPLSILRWEAALPIADRVGLATVSLTQASRIVALVIQDARKKNLTTAKLLSSQCKRDFC